MTTLPISGVHLETPSLFGRKKEEKQESEEVLDDHETEDRDHDFSNEELIDAWKEFRDIRKASNAGDMEMMVLNRIVEKKEPHLVLIRLMNSLEGSVLDRFEDEAIQYLRKKLGNSLLKMERDIQETETTKKLYTSKDKYEYMVSQNPALKELKERLGLDFDY